MAKFSEEGMLKAFIIGLKLGLLHQLLVKNAMWMFSPLG